MIDSHCHIAGEEFAADLPEVIARAKQAGLRSAMCVLAAGDPAEAAAAARVRSLWPAVRIALGIHPHQAGEHGGHVEEAVALVEREARASQAAAIGEIGLDYHYDFSPRPVQQEIFAAQVRLARAMSLPIVIHTREATDDTFRILGEEGGGEIRGVFHCFTGDATMAQRALDIGFHLSFAGILTFPKAAELREVARSVPLDRVLVETDAPYLAPVPHRGKRNEPAFVTRVVDVLAELRGLTPAAVSEAASGNFERLFGALKSA